MNVFYLVLWVVGLIISMFIVLWNFTAYHNSYIKRYLVYMVIGIIIAMMFISAILLELAGV